MLSGAIYCRVSTEDQETHGMSLPHQRETCFRFVRENGLFVPEDMVFLEQYSGGFLERPELDKLRFLASRKLLDFVVFAKRDRVARDQYVFQKIMKDFADAGVRVFYAEEKLTGDSAMDAFMGSTIVGFAAWEREQIKLRTTAGKRQHAKNNKWPFATVPFGYVKNPATKELELYEPEKSIILRIVRTYLYEHATLGSIAKTFSEEGVLPPSMSEKGSLGQTSRQKMRKNAVSHWSETTVHRILSKVSVFTGVYQAFQKQYKKVGNKSVVLGERPKDEWIDVKIPAIITAKEAEAVLEKLESNRRFAKKRAVRAYMLQGKLLCDCEPCMKHFVGYHNNEKNLRNYRCNNYNIVRISEDRRCKNHISGLKIEGVVTETLRELFLDPDFLFERAASEIFPNTEKDPESARDRYSELHALLMETEAKQKRNEELYIEGIVSKERFNEHRTTLEAKQAEYEKEMAREYAILRSLDHKEAAERSWQEVMAEMREETEEFFEQASYEDLKELVNLCIERVVVPTDRKKAVRITVKLPLPPEIQDKYCEDEMVEYVDEYGKAHSIVPTGKRTPRPIPLDPTKAPLAFRAVHFDEDG